MEIAFAHQRAMDCKMARVPHDPQRGGGGAGGRDDPVFAKVLPEQVFAVGKVILQAAACHLRIAHPRVEMLHHFRPRGDGNVRKRKILRQVPVLFLQVGRMLPRIAHKLAQAPILQVAYFICGKGGRLAHQFRGCFRIDLFHIGSLHLFSGYPESCQSLSS